MNRRCGRSWRISAGMIDGNRWDRGSGINCNRWDRGSGIRHRLIGVTGFKTIRRFELITRMSDMHRQLASAHRFSTGYPTHRSPMPGPRSHPFICIANSHRRTLLQPVMPTNRSPMPGPRSHPFICIANSHRRTFFTRSCPLTDARSPIPSVRPTPDSAHRSSTGSARNYAG